jgi:hypothetical protein
VAAQLGMDASRMYSRGTYTALPVSPVKFDGEEDVCRLRTPVSHEWLIGCSLEVRVFKINVRETMTGRGQVDQASAFAEERRDPVDEDKVTQVIGAELGLKTIGRMSERRCHDARISDDHVEWFALGQQRVGACADASEIGEVERDEFEAAAMGGGIVSHLDGGRFRFYQVPCRADYMRPMGSKRARSLHTDSGRDTGHQNSFALQSYARQNIFSR